MSELKHGPLNKDLHTQMYELIVKCVLEMPDKVQHNIKSDKYGKDTLFTYIGNASINLSELTQKINFNHLSFNQNDSYHFEQSYPTSFFRPEFGNGYHNEYNALSHAEKMAIYNYTGTYYHNINSFLHGNVDSIDYAWDYYNAQPMDLNRSVNELILNMGFLASGLNKIIPEIDHHSHTYRGEHSPSHDEIQMRIQLAQTEDGITHEPAFMSTSLNSYVSEGFSSGSLIIFDHTYGKNITGLSQFESEEEYLILPGYILWEAYDYHEGTFRFKAKVVAPLLDNANELSENELIQFKNLIDFAEKNHIKMDFITDFNQEKLKHSLEEVSLKTVIDNNTICLDEVLSYASDNNSSSEGVSSILPLSYTHSPISELFSQANTLLEVF